MAPSRALPARSALGRAASLPALGAAPVALLGAALVAPSPAAARPIGGFFEVSYGLTSPQGDDGYEESFEASTKLGFHAGPTLRLAHGKTPGMKANTTADAAVTLALDLGVDRTAMDERREPEAIAAERWRVTAGPRLAATLGNVLLFARGGVGLDRMDLDFEGLLGSLCENTAIDGLALEAAVGIGAQLGDVAVGAAFGVSRGDHRDDRPQCTLGELPVKVDVLDNRNTDVDLQLFVGWRL